MSETTIHNLKYFRRLNSCCEQGTLSIGDTIGEETFGGEGKVLKLLSLSHYNCDDFVIKIFHNIERNSDKESKIKSMLALSEKSDIPETVCWPLAIVYDENDKFVGYIMRKAQGFSLSEFMHGKKTQRDFHNYHDSNYIQMCLSILKTLEKLHEYNILVGDINEDNFIVRDPTTIYFIDSDSYQFGKYKCNVGRENYFSPEYYESQIANEDSEGYSIIILIFKILMLGRDPFTFRTDIQRRDKVIKGLFPYSLNDVEIAKLITPSFYVELWKKLSTDLKQYFINIFTRREVYNGTFDIKCILEQYLDVCNESPTPVIETIEEEEPISASTINKTIAEKNNSSETIVKTTVLNEKESSTKPELSPIKEDKVPKVVNVTPRTECISDNSEGNSKNDLLLKCITVIEHIMQNETSRKLSDDSLKKIKDELNKVLPTKLQISRANKKGYHISCSDLGIEAWSCKYSSKEDNYRNSLRILYARILKTKKIFTIKSAVMNDLALLYRTWKQELDSVRKSYKGSIASKAIIAVYTTVKENNKKLDYLMPDPQQQKNKNVLSIPELDMTISSKTQRGCYNIYYARISNLVKKKNKY